MKFIGITVVYLLVAAGVAAGLSIQKPKFKGTDTIDIIGSSKSLPAIGFGTCCRPAALGPPLVQSTKAYLARGGRHIDTAQIYNNHVDVARAIQESGVSREKLWITSKLQNYKTIPDAVVSEEGALQGVDLALRELGLTHLDLMLIHNDADLTPDEQVAVWRGLLQAKGSGKVKNVGVANFGRQQLENLNKATGRMPAVNQIEYHPWSPDKQHDLVKFCMENDIAVIAYGSLGGWMNKAQGETVSSVAKKHGVTNSQVLLRWALDQGVAVIPGATTDGHIVENLGIPDFHLDDKDLESLLSKKPLGFRCWECTPPSPWV